MLFHRLIRQTAYHHIQRSDNQCQRSTQLMTDIGKETEFHLVQFFSLPQSFLFLHTDHLLPITAVNHINKTEDQQNTQNGIEDAGSQCIPKRRMNHNSEFRLRSPYPVVSGCGHTENIFARRKIIIHNTSLSILKRCFNPFFIKAFQLITKRSLRRIREVQSRKFKCYIILIIFQLHCIRITQCFVKQYAPIIFLSRHYRNIEQAE